MSVSLTRPGQGHRIDHQGYAPEIWAGMLLTSLYLLQSAPLIGNIDDTVERLLDVALGLGSLLCLVGAALGTRLILPSTPKRCSYYLQLVGLPIIIVSLAWYTYSAGSSDSLLVIALGGGLGLCIEIGSVRMVVDIVEELTRTGEDP